MYGGVDMRNAFLVNVIMLNVVAPLLHLVIMLSIALSYSNAECHYSECNYGGCLNA